MANRTASNTGFVKVPTEDPQENLEVDDGVCGIGSFRPAWIQRLANAKAFMVLYCLLGMVEGASFTYMVGVLSTWEKRYAYDSSISGIIMISDNISSIFISVLVGFYGRNAHRPRWIACGMLVVAFACFVSSLPYFVYGPGLHLLNRNVDLNKTSYQLCQTDPPDEICDGDLQSQTVTVISIFFVANMLNGFGYTAFYTIGTAYMDDGVQKKDSPMYFGTQMALRLLGPSFGYVLASFSLQYYEDPFYDPGLTNTDPRWVGAWWMGFIILGFLLVIFALPMLLFPKRLPGTVRLKSKQEAAQDAAKLKIKDLPATFFRLIKNPIWLFHTLSIIFHINGYMGYFILMPRYMEHHFRQTASSASFFSGTTSLVTMIAGILLGGVAISRFRPRPRVLTGYMAAVAFFSVMVMVVGMFFSCPSLQIIGEPNNRGTLDLVNDCNSGCGCTTKVFQPVCSSDGESTYFSPCHAGCATKWESPGNSTVLQDCRCDAEPGKSLIDLIVEHCPFNCNFFIPYIVIMSLSKMIGSTSRVGSMLVNLRCVDPLDKNLALGGLSAMVSAFAFIPYPIVFGAIADSTCLVWEEKCSKRGNCWVYDVDKLRIRMHGASFGLIMVGAFFDAVVWYYSERLTGEFYDDPVVDSEVALKNMSSSAKDTSEERREEGSDSTVENSKIA